MNRLLLLFFFAFPIFAQISSLVSWNNGASGCTLSQRGTNSAKTATSSLTVSFPGGTAAGDLAVFFASGQNIINSNPSGWTILHNGNNAANWSDGAAYARVLRSGDISTGSVTAGATGNNIVGAVAVFTSSCAMTVREVEWGWANASTASVPVASSANVAANDYGVYWASCRCSALPTINKGSLQTSQTDSSANSGVLYTQAVSSGGAITATSSYTGYNPQGYFSAIVYVYAFKSPTFAWLLNSCSATSGSSPISCSWLDTSAPPATGDSVVCAVSTGSSGTWSVTDSASNTYSSTSQFLTSGNGWVQIFYFAHLGSTLSGTTSVTATFSAVTSGTGIACYAARNTATSNAAMFDASATATNSSTSGGTVTVTLSTAHTGEGVFCTAGMGNINGSGVETWGTGFVGMIGGSGGTTWPRWIIENLVQQASGSGSFTSTYSNAGVTSGMLCAAFNHV